MYGSGQNALLQVYHDLPITSFSGWDRVWQMEAILAVHDHGSFRESSILCDSMMRDDRISAVSDTRVSALIASPVQAKPANASAKAAKVAKEIGGDGEYPGLWSSMFPPSVIGELVWWGNWLGFGIAQVLWDTTGSGNVPSTAWQMIQPDNFPRSSKGMRPDAFKPSGAYKVPKQARWTPHLKVWHPQYIYWDWAQMRFVALCAEGPVTLPNTDEQIHSDGKWFVWAPHGYQYGWLKAMVRRLAHKYIMRGWNYRDWARYNERHGMPILGAVMPAKSNKEEKDAYKKSLANMGSDAVVPLAQGEIGNQYDLKIIESQGRTTTTFGDFKKELDDDIAITMLGQNMSTESHGSSLGSGKNAQMQNQVRIDKRIEDAHIDVAIRNQVLYWDAGFNYGDPELAPIVAHQVEPPEDESEEAQTLLALGQALVQLNTGAPGIVDVRAVLDRAGIPMLSEEEVAANKEIAKQEAQEALEAQQAAAPAAAPGDDDGKKPAPAVAAGKPKPKQLSAVEASIAKRYEFQGLPIAVENPAGSERHWSHPNPDGTQSMGVTRMLNDYGFIEGVSGADKDELDCYIGPDENAPDVHVVRQQVKGDPTKYDEDKVFLGFADAGDAKRAYLAHRDDGDACFGGMSTIPLKRFKAQIARRPAQSRSPIRTTATPTGADVVFALVSRLVEGRKPTALRSIAGNKRAARYPDTLETNAVRQAKAIMRVDLKGLVGDINEATSYDDLRDRIIRRYREKMKPDELAELIKKVILMAHVGGRFTATQTAGGK